MFNSVFVFSVVCGGFLLALVIFVLRVFSYLSYGKKCNTKYPKENGGGHVAKVLKAHGVKHVFVLCGGHISPVLVAIKKEGIDVVDVRDEATTVFAADAVARLTGVTGVAIVTAGPGVTNTITAVKNAQMAQSPVILIGGAAPSLLRGRGSLQDVDQLSIVKSMCKKVVSVRRVRDIVPKLKDLFRVSQEGVPGPCFIEIPIDLLYTYPTVISELKLKPGLNLVQIVIKYRVNRNFYKAFEKSSVDPTPHKVKKLRHSKGVVRQVARLLKGCKRPVVVLGSQVVKNKSLLDDTVDALGRLDLPYFVSGKSRGITGIKNPLCFRHNRSKFLRQADVILLLGVTPDFRLNYGRVLNKRAKVVTVNISKSILKLNTDIFWKPHRKIHSEPQVFLIDLEAEKSRRKYKFRREEWIKEIEDAEGKRKNEIFQQSQQREGDKINRLKLCFEIDKYMDENSILIVDGGDIAATASYIIRPRKYLSWMDPGPFGTLGVGAGFALGAKYVYPEKRVWVIYGDGAFGWSICEFDTFCRKGIKNIIAMIGNDACWGQVKRDQMKFFNDDVAMDLRFSRYGDCVRALGCEGKMISKDGEIQEGVKEVIDMAKENTVVLNALISKSKFRDGSISV